MVDYDAIIVGGGTVGISIAYGLTRLGKKTAVIDQGGNNFRATHGNFGLIWVQGKGLECSDYARWTRRSAQCWAAFARELEQHSKLDIQYSRPGGFHLCVDDGEVALRTQAMSQLVESSNGEFQCTMLGKKSLAMRLPHIGPTVKGASYSPQDGHVNPLLLQRALSIAFKAKGGILKTGSVSNIEHNGTGFEVATSIGTYTATSVVLAAGLGCRKLAPCLDLNVPVRPQRGQILVTERLKPFLYNPTSLVRQTGEGSILLGDSHEEVGFDNSTSIKVMCDIANRARLLFPHLDNAHIVRAWGALRILAPDGLPIYDQSPTYPGAFCASCHSGITLAAVHALDFAGYIANGTLPASLNAFSTRRFHAHQLTQ